MTKEKKHPSLKGDGIKNNLDERLKLLQILGEETNFQIITLLLIYKELTLSEIDDKLHKSRATIHRHLQKLEEYDLVEISRQETIRGPIPANFYQTKIQTLMAMGQISNQDIETMSHSQHLQFKQNLLHTHISICDFIQSILKILQDFLKRLNINDDQEFSQIYNLETSPLLLSFGLMTENQKKMYMQDFLEFNLKFQKKLIDQDLMELDKEKPHVNFIGFLPMKLIFEIMAKNSKN